MEKAWASSLAKASLIAAIKARMGFSSLACIVESAPRLSGEIANTTSVIAKRSWRECVMAVWDSTVDCDQNLVRSPGGQRLVRRFHLCSGEKHADSDRALPTGVCLLSISRPPGERS